jgi:branched-subunit amino acid transport protein
VTTLVMLAAAGAATWLLRVSLITILPACRLPERLRFALGSAGPAAMAAMLTTELLHGRSAAGAGVGPWVVGALTAAVLAHRLHNLTVTVLGGTVVYAGALLVV